ncbi:hypothetical protein INN71_12680 [Nocardioides sp. ChNu-153]|uniref:hypothetical protein n=1 Tax=unclassified Nocardioides TaxID=2615069 RepID=UPI0024063E14|nr:MULTISPECIES: hypothetical protein [unclassified Nocardioides]MDF9717044.1 hypothetical protein [Nocardioides sp. ChNu-99]MDN7122244.1 hypothetical protein [Nocardioides sp. ChNu-153]
MRTPSRKSTKIATAAATPVAVLLAGALVWQSSHAAFSGTTRNSGNSWSTGAVSLTDDDAGSARFQAENMTPGDTETKCIKVTATTNVSGLVKGYALNAVTSAQGLENYIKIGMTSGDGGGFGSCTGYVQNQTVVPSGTSLADLAQIDEYAEGVGGWSVAAGTSSRTYAITWTFDTTGLNQTQVDQLQGAKTGIDIQWELQTD